MHCCAPLLTSLICRTTQLLKQLHGRQSIPSGRAVQWGAAVSVSHAWTASLWLMWGWQGVMLYVCGGVGCMASLFRHRRWASSFRHLFGLCHLGIHAQKLLYLVHTNPHHIHHQPTNHTRRNNTRVVFNTPAHAPKRTRRQKHMYTQSQQHHAMPPLPTE